MSTANQHGSERRLRWLDWLLFAVGLLLLLVLVVTLLEGRGPQDPWTAVPVLAGLTMLLAMPFSLRLGLAGLAVLTVATAVALLVVPDHYVGGPGRLAPDSLTQARVMGVGLLALAGAAAWWWRSDREWRRLLAAAEGREQGLRRDS